MRIVGISEDVAGTYDEISERYHRERLGKKSPFNEFLEMPATLSMLEKIRGKKILDIGCGTGIYARILKRRGAKMFGIDISPNMIEIARSHVPDVDFRVGSVSKLPYKNGYFDIVFSAYVLHHFEDLDVAFSEISRVLKGGGVYIFSTTNPVAEVTRRIKGRDPRYRKFNSYFEEGRRANVWWHKKKSAKAVVPYIHRTYQTIIQAVLRNGFIIDDYLDAKPVVEAKKIDRRFYTWTTNVPQVCVFKIRKPR